MIYTPIIDKLKDEHCRICGCAFGTGNQRLMVHHLDGNHRNDVGDNRLIICHHCHHKLHFPVNWCIETVKQMRQEGCTLQAIGDTFGVTRQRIHQMLKRKKSTYRGAYSPHK